MFGDQFFTCKSNTKSVRAILNCQIQGYKMVVRPHKIGAKAVELNQPQPSISISWLSCFFALKHINDDWFDASYDSANKQKQYKKPAEV